MDSTTVSATKGADVFLFDYDHLDVTYSVALGAGNWGLYQADGTVVVADTLTPQIGTDGVTSLGGTFRTSISLAHVPTYTSARVHYDGSGFTLDYTLNNGTTWLPLAEDGVIQLSANADLDLRVTFPGSIANDPAVLNSLTVYILKTETISSLMATRTATTNYGKISDGTYVNTAGFVINAVDTSGTLDPNGPAQSGTADVKAGVIEMWATVHSLAGWNTLFEINDNVYSALGSTGRADGNTNHYEGCTVYIDGVPVSTTPVSVGVEHQFVFVFNTLANVPIRIGNEDNGGSPTSMTISHLAVYNKTMTANDVTSLYIGQTGGHILQIDGGTVITVTESSPATDIYAYAWQIQSGGS